MSGSVWLHHGEKWKFSCGYRNRTQKFSIQSAGDVGSGPLRKPFFECQPTSNHNPTTPKCQRNVVA
ncbi:hypothetical protein PCASD_07481 [Puccinia coronata f. sp. avenae]|uniref:Uncharacterized protein n=1 Tax=Puccinia coronata f. sp. avenae TaxID=200324 RepID=A0A2N5TG89_9BASI|nr:hypothetical protein PCASD_07481 [Puccinia coronata f. sp. avenae]